MPRDASLMNCLPFETAYNRIFNRIYNSIYNRICTPVTAFIFYLYTCNRIYLFQACTTLVLIFSTQIFATNPDNQKDGKNQAENPAESARSISRISHDYYDDHYETDEHSRIGRVKKYVEETYVPHGYVEEGYGGKDGYGHGGHEVSVIISKIDVHVNNFSRTGSF